MEATNGLRPLSLEKHLFLTLKVDFSKLKDVAPRTKVVILKLGPEKLAAFANEPEDDIMVESAEGEELEEAEPPLEDCTSNPPSLPHASRITDVRNQMTHL